MKMLNNAVIRDRYDVVVVGAGMGGLNAAALLAKRGLKVLAIDQHFLPGGCVSHVRRHDIAMDVGAAMLFGFGETGYKPHRFVMNELEEEIDMIPHDSIYRVHIYGKEITFWRDFERYFNELTAVFPNQRKELRGFYNDLYKIYNSMIANNEMPVPPTEVPIIEGIKLFFKNPLGMIRVLLILFKSVEDILYKYLTDPKAVLFFDTLTGTFSCVNVNESPAAMAASMFIDIHEGGACYPSGSPQMLPNKLEKALERYGGQILYRQLVDEILIFKGKTYGVRLAEGTEIMADRVISNATVWNLHGKLVRPRHIKPKRMKWAQGLVPTFSSLLLYIGVDKEVVPEGARSIEMFIDDPNDFGGDNFTVYIPSIDDPSICPPDTHSLTVIAPRKDKWPHPSDPEYHSEQYECRKEREADRIIDKMEKHFPNLRKHIRHLEIGTPSTIERFTLKNWGNVGGPKQMMGQELLKRPRARSDWKNLYLCGDSTVLGEGVVAAAASGVGAANMVLRDLGLKEYLPRKFSRQYVNLIEGKPWTPAPDPSEPITETSAMRIAKECQHCDDAGCIKACPAGIDVLNFIRRIETGNFVGAARSMRDMNPLAEICGYICPAERLCEKECDRREFSDYPVRIADLQAWVCRVSESEGWERHKREQNGHQVAVVGSGPAGLSCAHFLARLGYKVDIMEKSEKPGGMLTHAVPSFRLPSEVIEREIEGVLIPGISFQYGRELGKDFTVTELLKRYNAAFLAPGLWSGRKLEIPGKDGAGIIDALALLRSYREKGKVDVKGRVLVIGGGSVAADAVLAAKNSGANKVSLVCLEKDSEMPALPREITELNKQGVEIHNCWGPKEFISASKLSFVGCTSVFDDQGKFCPSYDESKSTEIEFDRVIMAVGQSVEPALASYLQEEFNRADLIEVDEDTMQVRGRPGLFAGGDIVRVAGTVVQAVADGRRAAVSIDARVRGEGI
ncbi:MAG: FAD-dependent oxidoreductase [Deltaproteobacteria bacterium]|nr:MAG: FAD-dependent oxidoreductase [Deltaproteobacteria bacterium]